jgi:carbon-monoxide dehydrogenase iron sulfur subunit
MGVCPTRAISRDAELDIVVIDGDKCITCAMCAIVCPFDVIGYYESTVVIRHRTVALKCDHCIERQRQGQIPACVEVCKVGALVFGDVNELVKAASSRLASSVSIATSEIRAEMPGLPAHVEAWRGWGEVVSQLNEAEDKEERHV